MHQRASTGGIGACDSYLIGELLQASLDILGDKILLMDILVAPGRQLFGIAHRARQGHRVPDIIGTTLEQHLGSRHEPCATLRCRKQGHTCLRVVLTSALEKCNRMRSRMWHIGIAGQYQFLVAKCRKSSMKPCKITVIGLSRRWLRKVIAPVEIIGQIINCGNLVEGVLTHHVGTQQQDGRAVIGGKRRNDKATAILFQ